MVSSQNKGLNPVFFRFCSRKTHLVQNYLTDILFLQESQKGLNISASACKLGDYVVLMPSVQFAAQVSRYGTLRKHIEIPKNIRDIIPTGRYQISISMMGTLESSQNYPTEQY